jgi:putative tryptophan/tyrosine transport system substrate-binding protein
MGTRSTLPAVPMAQQVPVVFSAVADPVGSDIVDRLDQRNKNITGAHCWVPAYAQIKTMLKVLPNVQNIGIVYTEGEKNAEIQLEEFIQTVKDFNLDIVTSSISEDCQSEDEIKQAAGRIIDQVDVFIILQDTSLSVYGQGLISLALEHRVPVYSSLSHLLPYGALLSLSANFKNIGLMAGRQAYRILAQGEKPQNLEITTDKKYLLVVNLKVAKELDIQIPVQVLKTASRIIK